MSRIEDDIKNLVFELTGDQNNDLSLEYCCIFMREALCEDAPMPRSFISSRLDTFVTKFDFLGFPQYAHQLSNAVSTFLENCDDEEATANWSALDLMLQLSTDSFNPEVLSTLEHDLAVSRVAVFPEEITEEVKINWFKYLQEGSEKYRLPYDDEDSDDERIVPSENADPLSKDPNFVPHYNEIFSDFRYPEEIVPEENTELKKTMKESVNAKSLLMKSVQHSWWNGDHCTVSRSIYPSANFGRMWETVQNKVLLSNHKSPSNFLYHDEYQIIRELLWVLITNEGGILKRTELLRTQTSVPSMIQETFASIVDEILLTAEKYHALTSFCDEVLGRYALQVSFTFQAYTVAIKDTCRVFLSKIIDHESIVKQQDTTYTLLTFYNDLKEDLRIINFLYQVHQECVVTNWVEEASWVSSVRLLSVLLCKYQEVSSKQFRQILLRIFFRTFKIYAEIIDVWLTEGKLNDWKNEFFIQKSESNGQYVAFPQNNGKLYGEVNVSPLFRQLSTTLLNCCQSIDFLCKLNKKRELRAEILKEGKLIDIFVNQLKQRTHSVEIQRFENKMENSFDQNISVNFILRHEYTGCINDVPFLIKAFGHQLSILSETTGAKSSNTSSGFQDERFENFNYTLAGPVLEQVLCNLIRKREVVIVGLFRNAIVEDYRFFEHIRSLKDILLMDWNGFCNSLQIRLEKQTWIGHNAIKVQLYESVENNKILSFSDLFRFSIINEEDMGNFEFNVSKIIKAIDRIAVQYKVQWPLNMIFTEVIVNSFYAPLLKLVLKIKFAFSTVTRLRFKDIPHVKLNVPKLRRIQVFRHWVALLLQKLHSYLLLAISQSLSYEAVENGLEIETFSSLQRSYTSYLNKTKRNCLIESEFFEHFSRALNRIWLVCDDVVNLWTEASRLQLSDHHVSHSVELYLQCLWYLTKILQKFLRGELCPLFDLWSDLNRMFEAHKSNIPEDLTFRSGQVPL